jgi:hypothetical protein
VVRFHGFGNATVDTAESSFYRAVHEEYNLRLLVGFSSDPDVELRVGPVLSLQYTDTTRANTLVAEQNLYGAGEFDIAGVEATFRYQPERSSFAPGLGVTVLATGQFFPAVLDAVEPFGGVGAEVDLTWVPRLPGAHRRGARAAACWAARCPARVASAARGRCAVTRWTAAGIAARRTAPSAPPRISRFRLGIAPGDRVLARQRRSGVAERGSVRHGPLGGGGGSGSRPRSTGC